MPKTKIFIFIIVLILPTLACNTLIPTSQTVPTQYVIAETEFPPQEPSSLPLTEADVPRVSLEATLVAIAGGSAVIVDVRSPEAYAASHIEGAVNIPLSLIEANPSALDLDKDEWIITYCT